MKNLLQAIEDCKQQHKLIKSDVFNICWFQRSSNFTEPAEYGNLFNTKKLLSQNFHTQALSLGTFIVMYEDTTNFIVKVENNNYIKYAGSLHIQERYKNFQLERIIYVDEYKQIQIFFVSKEDSTRKFKLSYGLNEKNIFDLEIIRHFPENEDRYFGYLRLTNVLIYDNLCVKLENTDIVDEQTFDKNKVFKTTNGYVYLDCYIKFVDLEQMTVTKFIDFRNSAKFSRSKLLRVNEIEQLKCLMVLIKDIDDNILLSFLSYDGNRCFPNHRFDANENLRDVIPIDFERVLLIYKERMVFKMIM